MKYVCSICGYVYDDEKEAIPFSELPASWCCPVCGAPKDVFVPAEPEKSKDTDNAGEPQKDVASASPEAAESGDDILGYTAVEMSAIMSNLARGCEKQYKSEESALFKELSEYFLKAAPKEQRPDAGKLSELLSADMTSIYPQISDAAKEQGDRGTQRVCVWGEKVTAVMRSLLERFRREGAGFISGKKVWVCSVCGFIYIGENPPSVCPVCKVPAWKFDVAERRQHHA